jgi:hypothetical protein
MEVTIRMVELTRIAQYACGFNINRRKKVFGEET